MSAVVEETETDTVIGIETGIEIETEIGIEAEEIETGNESPSMYEYDTTSVHTMYWYTYWCTLVYILVYILVYCDYVL